jgi:hypothetical protein
VTPAEHLMSVHTVSGKRYWLTCTCGWRADDLPNNWDEWARLCREHRFEVES